MRLRINRRAIDALKPPAKGQSWLHDTELHGFMVLCQVSGRKSYMLRYKEPSGAIRKTTIGKCAELHPDEAREIARTMLAKARKGEDVVLPRDIPTIEQLSERFMEEHASKLKFETRRGYKSSWRHINAHLGKLKVPDVIHDDIVRYHRASAFQPYAANRRLALLGLAFRLAEEWGLRPRHTNPCEFVNPYKEKHRTRTLSEEEFERLWEVLETGRHRGANFVKLLMLTGCRCSEIQRARWSWFDLDNNLLNLPDSKTGPRTVYLPQQAVDLLRSMPRVNEFILPGDRSPHMMNAAKIWNRIKKDAGLDGVRLHDLRHTVGSLAHRSGMSLRAVADMLGHAKISTTERYINTTEGHKVAGAKAWSGMLAKFTEK